jgi:hypothetical protein
MRISINNPSNNRNASWKSTPEGRAGHSADILFKHYRQLVTEADELGVTAAQRWFAIAPADGVSKVVPMRTTYRRRKF